jgi:hypothetical protein
MTGKHCKFEQGPYLRCSTLWVSWWKIKRRQAKGHITDNIILVESLSQRKMQQRDIRPPSASTSSTLKNVRHICEVSWRKRLGEIEFKHL